mmetsp:Transcript_19819/g.30624  ORF Transcript_19819/g.30624 Transcript_19819/m.30624 type:complete len:255 (-) Transcript_19819:46-810(-)
MKLNSLFALSLALSGASSFMPSQSNSVAFSRQTKSSTSQLANIIRADAEDFTFDQGQGGVRLAVESAIKILGDVKHAPGSASTEVNNLLRYTKVSEVDDSVVKSVMSKVGSTLICTGKGEELYKDPGETSLEEIRLGPNEAIKDALVSAGSVSETGNMVINFLGGDDLMFDEVVNALTDLILDLSPPTKCKVSFNSLCHTSFPNGSATVTVLSTQGESKESMKGAEKAVASGEVYFRDGKWYTVAEEDINEVVA